MSSGEIFITVVIPAAVLAVAYLAVLGNEWAVRRLDHPPGE